MIFSIVSLILKLSGLIFWVIPIRSIVRKGEIPEFPERVREKAVLDMALRIKLMVGSINFAVEYDVDNKNDCGLN